MTTDRTAAADPSRTRSSTYAIDGGLPGKTRLNVIADGMRLATTALLETAGILELARADAEADGLTTIDDRIGAADALEGGPFDVVYARFLPSRVADPGGVVAAMAEVATGGGVVIVEDIDFTASFCRPDSAAFGRYVELYQETVRRRGGNSGIGPALPALLRSAGLRSIGVHVVQPVAFDGPLKMANHLTLDRIASAVVLPARSGPCRRSCSGSARTRRRC